MKNQIKILIAKPGLDGHDKGAKIVALALKDAGIQVIYSGLHKNLEDIIDEAEKENVSAIGLSIMTGSHISICNDLIAKLKKSKLNNIKLLVGGVIPKKDIKNLTELGIHAVFPNGAKIDAIVDSVKALF